MYDIDACILITNNDRAANLLRGKVRKVVLLEQYRDVLIQARDMIYSGHKLLSHPQASSLKPNQTPYRTLLLYGEIGEVEFHDITLIENAIEMFDKWQDIRPTPVYADSIANDYKTIDLSMIENILNRL